MAAKCIFSTLMRSMAPMGPVKTMPLCVDSQTSVFYNDNTYEVKSILLYCLLFVRPFRTHDSNNLHTQQSYIFQSHILVGNTQYQSFKMRYHNVFHHRNTDLAHMMAFSL